MTAILLLAAVLAPTEVAGGGAEVVQSTGPDGRVNARRPLQPTTWMKGCEMQEHPITRAASGKAFRCILTTRTGVFAIVDAEQYEWLTQWRWGAMGTGYIMRGSRGGSSAKGAPRVTRLMHRELMAESGADIADMDVDHINRQRADNRLVNLRAVTRSQNNFNWGRSRTGRILSTPEERDPIPPDQLVIAIQIAMEIANRKPEYGPITLSKGMVAWVSPEDFDFVMQWKWSYAGHYAGRRTWMEHLGRKTSVYMHRLVADRMGIGGPKIDHIDGDKLNNRRENLRVANAAQNTHNSPKRSTNKSGHKGVCWDPRREKWVAQITVYGKHPYLGAFDRIEDAAEAYRQAAIQYFGEFARF